MSLDTRNGFAFLEARAGNVSVESLGRSFSGLSAHTGMKVRPSTNGDLPSILQLSPGQSIYVGKSTLSLVPEEHSTLVDSSGLTDSDLESHSLQVSQHSTPHRTVKVGSTVMETPMPHQNHESDISTPILDQVTGQAISGREDSKKWLESLLEREVMRTVRDASERRRSGSQPELRKKDNHMYDAAIDESDRSNPQAKVKTEYDDTADATIAKISGEAVVDLEDLEMSRAESGSQNPETSVPLPLNSSMHHAGGPGGLGDSRILEQLIPLSRLSPDEGLINSSTSPKLAMSKHDPSCVVRVQPERPETSDQSPSAQATADSSPQPDDDLDDTPVRKKARAAKISQDASNEDSPNSLQEEIAIKRGNYAPLNHPHFLDQASITFPAPSIDTESRIQPEPGFLIPSAGSRHVSPKTDLGSRPHRANRPRKKSTSKLTEPSPQTPVSVRSPVTSSPSSLVDPSSLTRNTRSTARDENNSPLSKDGGKCIVFASSSSAGDSKPFLKFLSSKGVKKVKSVHDCTILCVGNELKKTSKLILAVLLGKDIVTDSWVTDSVKGDSLLGVVPYMARHPEKEADWGISLDEAIWRGKNGLKVLQDQNVLFTPSAKKELGKTGFDELMEIARCAGAKSVSAALPKKNSGEKARTIVVGTQDKAEMAELRRLGCRVYVKDIISLSILRGKLDLDSDEFLIKEQEKESRKRKR